MKDIKLKIDKKFYRFMNENRDFLYKSEFMFDRDPYYFLLAKFKKFKSIFNPIHFYIN